MKEAVKQSLSLIINNYESRICKESASVVESIRKFADN